MVDCSGERDGSSIIDGEQRQVMLLADLILDQFGKEDFREALIGVDRREAERLSRRWLRQLLPDE